MLVGRRCLGDGGTDPRSASTSPCRCWRLSARRDGRHRRSPRRPRPCARSQGCRRGRAAWRRHGGDLDGAAAGRRRSAARARRLSGGGAATRGAAFGRSSGGDGRRHPGSRAASAPHGRSRGVSRLPLSHRVLHHGLRARAARGARPRRPLYQRRAGARDRAYPLPDAILRCGAAARAPATPLCASGCGRGRAESCPREWLRDGCGA